MKTRLRDGPIYFVVRSNNAIFVALAAICKHHHIYQWVSGKRQLMAMEARLIPQTALCF
jgi:hypothetical protein